MQQHPGATIRNKTFTLRTLQRRSVTSYLALLLSFFMLLQATKAFADIDVSVDRSSVSIQDTLQLTITSNEDVHGEPDISPITADFDIINRSQSSSLNLNNQGLQRSTSYRYTVQPKRAGKITIPSLQWGPFKSQPLTLNVTQAQRIHPKTNTTGTATSNLFVELEVDTSSPYVQGHLLLTLRSYSSQPFRKGGFTDLQLPPGIVAQSTGQQDRLYQTTLQGVRYLVQERNYILYGERSGHFEIGPALFQAYFDSGRRDFFGQAEFVSKRAYSDTLNLEIKPIPNTATRPWLPAKQLTLSHYLSEADQYRVGEPITLTLSTIADGLSAEQLPNINLQLPDHIKAYPDQPDTETRWENSSITGKRVDKIALIPTQSGNFTLPEIAINWWNTKTDQQETTTIPAISLNITAAPTNTTHSPPSSSQSSKTIEDTQKTNSSNPILQTQPSHTSGNSNKWFYIAIGFGLLWLLTTVAFLCLYTKYMQQKQLALEKKSRQKKANLTTSALIKTLQQGDARQALNRLLQWARDNIDSTITHTDHLSPYLSLEFRNAIDQLNHFLYGQHPSPSWDPAPLVLALRNFHSAQTTADNQIVGNRFPSLYPENQG